MSGQMLNNYPELEQDDPVSRLIQERNKLSARVAELEALVIEATPLVELRVKEGPFRQLSWESWLMKAKGDTGERQ